jgi:hypothetical protein
VPGYAITSLRVWVRDKRVKPTSLGRRTLQRPGSCDIAYDVEPGEQDYRSIARDETRRKDALQVLNVLSKDKRIEFALLGSEKEKKEPDSDCCQAGRQIHKTLWNHEVNKTKDPPFVVAQTHLFCPATIKLAIDT